MLAYGLQNIEDNVGNLYSKNLAITSTEKLKGKKSLDSKSEFFLKILTG